MFTLFCGLELREMKRTHTMYLVQRAGDGVGDGRELRVRGTVTVLEPVW